MVRPVLEGRPADRVVAVRRIVVERVLEHGAAPVRAVVGAVDERHGHAVRVPRPAAVRAAAEELEGHHVDVRVDEAAHLGERRGAVARLAVALTSGSGNSAQPPARPRRRTGPRRRRWPASASTRSSAGRTWRAPSSSSGKRDPERAPSACCHAPVGVRARLRRRLEARCWPPTGRSSVTRRWARRPRGSRDARPKNRYWPSCRGLHPERLGLARGCPPTRRSRPRRSSPRAGRAAASGARSSRSRARSGRSPARPRRCSSAASRPSGRASGGRARARPAPPPRSAKSQPSSAPSLARPRLNHDGRAGAPGH